jgi:hypothetical protein
LREKRIFLAGFSGETCRWFWCGWLVALPDRQGAFTEKRSGISADLNEDLVDFVVVFFDKLFEDRYA